jgi:hypothetical protein
MNTLSKQNMLKVQEVLSGWKNEIEERRDGVANFLQQRYNSLRKLSGFEVSGGSPNLINQITNGVISPKEVNVLYNQGKIEQIHIVFVSGDNNTQSVDIYLEDQALEGFLSNLED